MGDKSEVGTLLRPFFKRKGKRAPKAVTGDVQAQRLASLTKARAAKKKKAKKAAKQ